MTVLSSKDGKFYDVPEDVLKKHAVPAERVKEILAEFDNEMGPAGPGGVPAVVIHVSGGGAYAEPTEDVEPYAHHHHHGHHHGGWGGWGGWGPGPYVPPPWVFFPRRRYW
jgi:hypothetical protein